MNELTPAPVLKPAGEPLSPALLAVDTSMLDALHSPGTIQSHGALLAFDAAADTLLFASANRDPEVWDDPDTIRFDRDPQRLRSHLAFGWGVHHCIGASLARLEAHLVLERVVAGLASLEVVDPPITTSPFILRGFRQLRMRWTPSGGAITDRSVR